MDTSYQFEMSVPPMISFLHSVMSSVGNDTTRHVYSLDYDMPVNTTRQEIDSVIDSAEGAGAIKGELCEYDPHYTEVKLRSVLKFMKIDMWQHELNAAILRFGKSMWTNQLSRDRLVSLTSDDLDEATSYLLARYAFTSEQYNAFFASMNSESPSIASEFKQFYSKLFVSVHSLISRHVAHFIKSLGKQYHEIDMNALPDKVKEVGLLPLILIRQSIEDSQILSLVLYLRFKVCNMVLLFVEAIRSFPRFSLSFLSQTKYSF